MNRADIVSGLKQLEPRLRAHGIVALYLYGSFARDEAGPDSDIDVLVDFAEGRDTDLTGFLAPYHDLEEAFPGTEIGFSTRDRLVGAYREQIENGAVRIF